MKNTMYFGAGSSRTHRCVVTGLPSIPAAEARGEWEELDGLHGSQFRSGGALEAIDMPVSLWVPPDADVNAILQWLSGGGNLRFNDWPWFWRARRTAQFNLIPCTMDDGWNANVTFKVQPHRYLYPEVEPFEASNASFVHNPCTAESEPLIEITGSGEVDLMVGDRTMYIDLSEGAITLDCEAGIAYGGEIETFMSRYVTPVEGWPILKPGDTAISWSGDITTLRITPRWRWI